jgi:hypothetical protein
MMGVIRSFGQVRREAETAQWRTPRGFDNTQKQVVAITTQRRDRPPPFEDSLVNDAVMRFERQVMPWDQRHREMQTASLPEPFFGMPLEGSVHTPVSARDGRRPRRGGVVTTPA